MRKHHDPGKDGGRGIDPVLPRILRRGTMHRLKERGGSADIGAGGDPEPSDKPCAQVGNDIPVKVRSTSTS